MNKDASLAEKGETLIENGWVPHGDGWVKEAWIDGDVTLEEVSVSLHEAFEIEKKER